MRIDISTDTFETVDLGSFSLLVDCFGGVSSSTLVVSALGDPGAVQFSIVRSKNDGELISSTGGVPINGSAMVTLGSGSHPGGTSGQYYRAEGTFVVTTGDELTTVVFDAFLENRANQQLCLMRGSATPTS